MPWVRGGVVSDGVWCPRIETYHDLREHEKHERRSEPAARHTQYLDVDQPMSPAGVISRTYPCHAPQHTSNAARNDQTHQNKADLPRHQRDVLGCELDGWRKG